MAQHDLSHIRDVEALLSSPDKGESAWEPENTGAAL